MAKYLIPVTYSSTSEQILVYLYNKPNSVGAKCTCDWVSIDSTHFPNDTFHSLMQRSLEPPPVASRFDLHGHHDTACIRGTHHVQHGSNRVHSSYV